MALVKNPLHSISASGKIADNLSFRTSRLRQQACFRIPKKRGRTPYQNSVRRAYHLNRILYDILPINSIAILKLFALKENLSLQQWIAKYMTNFLYNPFDYAAFTATAKIEYSQQFNVTALHVKSSFSKPNITLVPDLVSATEVFSLFPENSNDVIRYLQELELIPHLNNILSGGGTPTDYWLPITAFPPPWLIYWEFDDIDFPALISYMLFPIPQNLRDYLPLLKHQPHNKPRSTVSYAHTPPASYLYQPKPKPPPKHPQRQRNSYLHRFTTPKNLY